MPSLEDMKQLLVSELKKPQAQQAVRITATVENGVPPQYRVSITQFGAVFSFNPPGRTEKVGPYSYNLGYGQSTSLQSSNTPDCCDEIFFALEVTQQGYPPVTKTELRRAPPGQCLLASKVRLIINSAVSSQDLASFTASGDIMRLLSLQVE